jgi:hypothetical protein
MPQNLLNPFQRVFAMSLGIHSEVGCGGDDEFSSISQPIAPNAEWQLNQTEPPIVPRIHPT